MLSNDTKPKRDNVTRCFFIIPRGLKRLLLPAVTIVLIIGVCILSNHPTPIQADGPPAINNVTGTFEPGQSVTINGSGFGVKGPQVEPWIWDDFESGTVGENIQGWELWRDTPNPYPSYTDEDVIAGTRSAKLNFEGHQSHNALLKFREDNSEAMFGALKYKVIKTAGYDSRGFKLFRLLGEMPGDEVHGTPVVGWGGADSMSNLDPDDPEATDFYNSWNAAYWGGSDCLGPTSNNYAPSSRDEWHSISQWVKLSEPDGTNNGLVGRRFDTDFGETVAVTKCGGSWREGLNEAAIGLYVAHDRHMDTDGDGDIDNNDSWPWVLSDHIIYVDDVYIDTTMARVELCDQSTWGDGNCEVQIPHTTWVDDQIQFTVNQGSFGHSSTAYVYVVDANGVANETGYQVTFGGVSTPPAAAYTGTPTSGTTPLAVSFTDQSTNNPNSWSWTFGDGGTSTSQSPSHTYLSPGTFNVSLTATNNDGSDVETKTGYITVTAPQNNPPVLASIGNKTFHEQETLTFNVLASDDDPEDTLTLSASNLPEGASFTDNGGGSGTFSWTPTDQQADTYSNIRFEVTDGTDTDSENITITVLDGVADCTPAWECSNWSVCTDSLQTRSCDDHNLCGSDAGRPVETAPCDSTAPGVVTNLVAS